MGRTPKVIIFPHVSYLGGGQAAHLPAVGKHKPRSRIGLRRRTPWLQVLPHTAAFSAPIWAVFCAKLHLPPQPLSTSVPPFVVFSFLFLHQSIKRQ